MSHGVPYFLWRDGRPRWSPGPELRAQGWKGVDLRGANGSWLALDRALNEARKLNEEAKRTDDPRSIGKRLETATSRLAVRGYIYFLRVADHVKIGFSKHPWQRERELAVGSPTRARLMLSVEGSRADEVAAHAALRVYREHGEWFRADREVLTFMIACATYADVSRALDQLNSSRILG